MKMPIRQCVVCGSYAINLNKYDRDASRPELCDVCYWKEKYFGLLKRTNIIES